MRPRLFDSDKVLDQAFEQFWSNGIRSTSIADLARATGLQRGSLYNAYGGKEGLFLAAYERYAQGYLAEVDKAMTGNSLRAQLEGYCRVSISNFCRGRPSRSCPTTKGLMESDDGDSQGLGPESRKVLSSLVTRIVSRVERAFVQGVERGDFVGDPSIAATHLVAVVRGLVIHERTGYTRKQLTAPANHTIDLILK